MRKTSVLPDNEFMLLTGAGDIFSHLIHDLHHAHCSIDMEFYIFEGDRLGLSIINILCRKARSGLRVRMLIDGFGSRHLSASLRRHIRACGVSLNIYNRISHRRLHRKLVIIDNHITYVGGANIAERYVVGNHLGPWHDAQLRIVGRECLPFVELFECDLQSPSTADDNISTRGHKLHLYHSTCHNRDDSIATAFEHSISLARHTLQICTPYFIPPTGLIQRLGECATRGVEIKLYLPERCGIAIIDAIVRHHAIKAATAGVKVFLCHNLFPHAKLIVADHHHTLVGSANLDFRSLRYNSEVMVGIGHRSVAKAAERLFFQLDKAAVPLAQYNEYKYLPHSVSRLLGSLF